MDLPDIANHLLNFAAPALFVALLLALASRVVAPRGPASDARSRHGFWRSFCVNAAVGVAVLVAGLIMFGRDGRMATYAALIVACGSSQWLLRRGSRDSSRASDPR